MKLSLSKKGVGYPSMAGLRCSRSRWQRSFAPVSSNIFLGNASPRQVMAPSHEHQNQRHGSDQTGAVPFYFQRVRFDRRSIAGASAELLEGATHNRLHAETLKLPR